VLRDKEHYAFNIISWIFGALLRFGLTAPAYTLLGDYLLIALLKYIDAALEKQYPEDVLLELASIHLATQDISGGIEMTFELGKRQSKYKYEPDMC
jgi:hypothetical protein